MVMPSDVPAAMNEADLYGRYINQLGIPTFGASPYQKWQMQQIGPTLGSYVMETKNRPQGYSLEDFMRNYGILGARANLPGQYNAMMASPDTGAADWTRQSLGDLWNDMLGSMASSKYGRFFGPQLAQGFPQMQRQYEATPTGIQAPGELGFLQYLRQKYGI